MKIAIISSVFGNPWAGSEELWYQTSLRCLEDGHQVMASVFDVAGPCEQFDNFRGKGGILLSRKRFKNGRLHVLKYKFLSAFKPLFDWKPDVLILSLGAMTDLGMYPDLQRHLEDNPDIKIIMVTLFNDDNIILGTHIKDVLKSICIRTNHFVFVSNHNYELAERQLALKLNNVSVFSSPVSYLGSYEKLPWPGNDNEIRMACVARLGIRNKGQDILLQALSKPQWRSRPWHLTIYGQGPDETYIRDLITFYDLGAKVSFGGFVSDTREIWKTHHWQVMASRSEGLSLALLEGMICGRICIVTDVGGHGEVINDAVSGFLAEAPTPKYFSAALERAWALRTESDKIGEAAYLAAARVFQDKPVDKMINLIFND